MDELRYTITIEWVDGVAEKGYNGETDLLKMAAIDQANIQKDPGEILSMILDDPNTKVTVTVVPV